MIDSNVKTDRPRKHNNTLPNFIHINCSPVIYLLTIGIVMVRAKSVIPMAKPMKL